MTRAKKKGKRYLFEPTHTLAALKYNNEKFVLPIIVILIIITTIKKIHNVYIVNAYYKGSFLLHSI